MNRHPPARGGSTLIELMITLVILSAVMLLVSMSMIAQQKAYWSNDRRRDAQAQARVAVGFLERDLAMAGYGLEPALGLDFSIHDRLGTMCAGGGAPPTAGTACVRDRTDRPDEIVVRYRDPEYWGNDTSVAPVGHAWKVSSVPDATHVVLSLRATDNLAIGRVLQLVCSGGQDTAYVTVAATATAAAAGDVSVQVSAVEAGNPFKQAVPTSGCFANSSTRAFVVLTRHYYVETVDSVPYLFLDEGYDRDGADGIDVKDRVAVAEGIEDLQVAYNVLTNATTEARRGATPGTAIAFTGITTRSIPAFDPATCTECIRTVDFTADANRPRLWSYLPFSSGSAQRAAPDAANVRAITFAVVGRSLIPTRDRPGTAPPKVFNRDAAFPATGGFERSLLFGTVQPSNLLARGLPFL